MCCYICQYSVHLIPCPISYLLHVMHCPTHIYILHVRYILLVSVKYLLFIRLMLFNKISMWLILAWQSVCPFWCDTHEVHVRMAGDRSFWYDAYQVYLSIKVSWSFLIIPLEVNFDELIEFWQVMSSASLVSSDRFTGWWVWQVNKFWQVDELWLVDDF